MSKVSTILKDVLDSNINLDKITEDVYNKYAEMLYDILSNGDFFQPLYQLEDTRKFSIGKPVYHLQENGTNTKLRVTVSLDTYDNIEEFFVLELNGHDKTYVDYDFSALEKLGMYGSGIGRVEDNIDELELFLDIFRKDIRIIENLSNY